MVDVSDTIAEFESVLREGKDVARCREVLAILSRWQWDPDLHADSRTAAQRLVREFLGRF